MRLPRRTIILGIIYLFNPTKTHLLFLNSRWADPRYIRHLRLVPPLATVVLLIPRFRLVRGHRMSTTELSYGRAHEDPDDIPLLRLFCAQLAMAMKKNGLDQHPAVPRWLEIAREDPLPEVRNAVL